MLGARIRKQIDDLYGPFMDPRGAEMRQQFHTNAAPGGSCKEKGGDTPEESIVVFMTIAWEAHSACWTAMRYDDEPFMYSQVGQFMWKYWFHAYSHVLEILAENPELEKQVWPNGLPAIDDRPFNIDDIEDFPNA